MARMAPSTAAPPAMSYLIFSMSSAGLMEMPPVSNVTPLPTRPRWSLDVGAAGRLVAHDDQSGRFGAALRDAEQARPCQAAACGPDRELRSRGQNSAAICARALRPSFRGVRMLGGSLARCRE